MPNAQAFKKLHVFAIFFLLIIAYGIYLLSKTSPLEQSIINNVKVNSQVNLFITEVNAGATTDFSYHFYLYDSSKSVGDFKRSLNDKLPSFFITADRNALSKIENGFIYLSVKGRVYSFNNYPSYKYNNSIYSVPVVITAKPY